MGLVLLLASLEYGVCFVLLTLFSQMTELHAVFGVKFCGVGRPSCLMFALINQLVTSWELLGNGNFQAKGPGRNTSIHRLLGKQSLYPFPVSQDPGHAISPDLLQ